MDKKRKTRWEKNMRLTIVTLIILLSVLFGLACWFIGRLHSPI